MLEPVPTSGGGRKAEPELDAPSNILKAFNDQFGNIEWTAQDRIHKIITEEIPAKVHADTVYQNAIKHSDRAAARMEHDRALESVNVGMLADNSELSRQFFENRSFEKLLADSIFWRNAR